MDFYAGAKRRKVTTRIESLFPSYSGCMDTLHGIGDYKCGATGLRQGRAGGADQIGGPGGAQPPCDGPPPVAGERNLAQYLTARLQHAQQIANIPCGTGRTVLLCFGATIYASDNRFEGAEYLDGQSLERPPKDGLSRQ